MYKLKINPSKINDGTYLEKNVKNDEAVLFYEIVVLEGSNKPIIRKPFHPSVDKDMFDLIIWESTEMVPPEDALNDSMNGHMARFTKYPLEVHLYKITEDVDDDGNKLNKLGYKRHIEEINSSIQDLPMFVIESKGVKPKIPLFIEDFQYNRSIELISNMEKVYLTQSTFGSRTWLTQRYFYGTTGVTSSNGQHQMNLTLAIRHFLRTNNKKYASLLEMIVDFGKIMSDKRIAYKPDTKFAQVANSTDAGDALVEESTTGDCEDLGHFYMRMFRMLCKIYKYVLKDKESDLYKKCKLLHEQYVPFNYICRVKTRGGKLDFHSTILILPRSSENPVLSFEVTDPTESYTLPDKEYDSWHIEHYFILEPFVIHRLNRLTDPISPKDISTLNISNLFPFNY